MHRTEFESTLFALGKLSSYKSDPKLRGSYVDTPIIADAIRLGALQAEFDRTPMRRPSSVEEVADSISFLASPMSSYMCGAALVMDGGYTI